MAVAGQAVTVAAVYFGLGFELPIGLCALVISLSAWLNIYLRMRYEGRLWLRSIHASAMLGYDVLQLATTALSHRGSTESIRVSDRGAPVTVSVFKAAAAAHACSLAFLVFRLYQRH